ncbi:MAG TPA: DUF6691 family protein [Cyclobacteriaceae bacterium]|nr:DUF6691 family protein [Cyclobacteriaceae bacterium]
METTSYKQSVNTDFEISSLDNADSIVSEISLSQNLKYLFVGILFGILLIKAEVVSWYRIQEMFRFQSFHMYGVIGSAVVVGALSVWLLKKFNVKSISGEAIQIPKRKFHKGTVIGGLLFGFGWALTGACPGPLFALIGNGAYVVIISLFSAIAGTWIYGAIRNSLPH